MIVIVIFWILLIILHTQEYNPTPFNLMDALPQLIPCDVSSASYLVDNQVLVVPATKHKRSFLFSVLSSIQPVIILVTTTLNGRI